MDVNIDPTAVKTGFEAAKTAIETLKGLREFFRSDPAKHQQAIEQIEIAEREIKLAEAQIAHALGYPLCRAHFPPLPMLNNRVEPQYVETIYRCPDCGREDPPSEHFDRKRKVDDSVRAHNERARDRNAWLYR